MANWDYVLEFGFEDTVTRISRPTEPVYVSVEWNAHL